MKKIRYKFSFFFLIRNRQLRVKNKIENTSQQNKNNYVS